MRLRHLRIENFRGIEQLDWVVPLGLVCLIGPGDSGKSTILDAIRLVFYPRHDASFSEADFHNFDISKPILIEATIDEFSEDLRADNRFGMLLRGWQNDKVQPEPLSGDASVLSLRLRVDDNMEPKWQIFTNDHREEKDIQSADRVKLGVSQLGDRPEQHMVWGRNSALLRLTDGNYGDNTLVNKLNRIVRDAALQLPIDELAKVANSVAEMAREFGASVTKLRPSIDPTQFKLSQSMFSLHDELVPARLLGRGTMRLVGLGSQILATTQRSLLLIDEIETALEPHRIRHLLRKVRPSNDDDSLCTQTICTTHSPIVLVEAQAAELSVVRRQAHGKILVRQVASSLQSLVRSNPEALLAKSIVICEGKTEVGIIRSLDRYWIHSDHMSLGELGVVAADGGGTSGTTRAVEFAQLGYRVCIWRDSDVPLDQRIEQELATANVKVIQWQQTMAAGTFKGQCTEQAIFSSSPDNQLQSILDIAASEPNMNQVVLSGIKSAFKVRCPDVGSWKEENISQAVNLLQVHGLSMSEIRDGLASASVGKQGRSKEQGWFKRTDRGEKLGDLVATFLDQISDTEFGMTIEKLRAWLHDNAPTDTAR